MAKLKENILIFLVGAMIYSGIEVLWRGFTHWSMAVTGGICFAAIYVLSESELSYIPCAFISALIITTAEFWVGIIFNIVLEKQIWDYSTEPLNILGQICPKYSFYWFILSLAAIPLCRLFKKPLNYLFSGTIG